MSCYFYFIASWTGVVMRVILYPCILCVALLMDLFVLCVCKLFGEAIRNMLVVILLFVIHLASSSIIPAGSVHKSRGDSVVSM